MPFPDHHEVSLAKNCHALDFTPVEMVEYGVAILFKKAKEEREAKGWPKQRMADVEC